MTGNITVTLTPKERALIHEALTEYRQRYRFSASEIHLYGELLHRIPKPDRSELR